jgi:16S rRNA (adenine1518-N6/adenine1519-N6)-dimethyltransferase
LHIEIDPALRARIPDLAFFQEFTRSMFMHRRKYLRSQLLYACGNLLSKPDVDGLTSQAGLSPEQRAEQLTVEQMLELSESVRQLQLLRNRCNPHAR